MPTLAGLQDWMRRPAEMLVEIARYNDRGFVVTSVRRSTQEQARLYQEFLSGKSGGLPAAPPGRSYHEYGRAFDLARFAVHPLSDPLLPLLGELWKSWGGTWRASDPIHFQA